MESLEDMYWVIDELKQDKKIAMATHNIAAWRIQTTTEKGTVVLDENRDDDGETGAGDKLLFMLQRLNAINVVGKSKLIKIIRIKEIKIKKNYEKKIYKKKTIKKQ